MRNQRRQIAPPWDLLLTGGAVLTMDDHRTVFDPGAVAIVGNRIAAVGSPDELLSSSAKRMISCEGGVVLPGFVDCHTHFFQSLARGFGDGLGLWPWLRDIMWPYGAAMKPSEAQVAATLGSVLAIRSGTTAVLDHHNSPNDLATTIAVAAAIDDSGLRAVVGRTIRGPRPPLGEGLGVLTELCRPVEEELDITRGCLEARPPGGRVAVWPAPANPVHVEQTMFLRSVELAREFGSGWHTHCSEASTDPEMYMDAYGLRPVDWLYKEGLLGADATLAHAIWLDDQEIRRVGETRSGVAYNAASNAYLGCGVMRLRDLRSAGARVGLGTDGIAVAGASVLRCMEQAVLQQRVRSLDPTASNAEEALELATREGARYLGIEAGILAPGRLADLAVVDISRPHLRPVGNMAATLVYAAESSDVALTVVDGTVVYEAGRCQLVDEEGLMREVDSYAKAIAKRVGLEGLRSSWGAQSRDKDLSAGGGP